MQLIATCRTSVLSTTLPAFNALCRCPASMLSYSLEDQAADLNVIAEFLARRDIEQLVPHTPSTAAGASEAHAAGDLLILAGNSLPCTAAMAAAALDAGSVPELLITGGIGHATQYLRDAVALVPQLQHIVTADRPEADIMADMVSASRQHSHVSSDGRVGDCSTSQYTATERPSVLLESASTNCGDNAVKSVQLLQRLNTRPGTVVLMQDPTMQVCCVMLLLASPSAVLLTVLSMSTAELYVMPTASAHVPDHVLPVAALCL